MNIYQRIVLVVGAITLWKVVYYAPVGGVYNEVAGWLYHWPQRAVTVIGSTMFIWWALSGIGKKNGK